MTGRTFEPGTEQTGPSNTISIFSGAGIGLMVGLLLGLSANATVGIFIGAVGTGLAALLGLNDRHFSTAKGLRIGAFGVAAALGAPGGIFIRDHGLVSPSLADIKAEYLALGFDTAQALEFLTRPSVSLAVRDAANDDPSSSSDTNRASGAPPNRQAQAGAGSSRFRPDARSLVFASTLDPSYCSISLYTDYDAELTPSQVISNFQLLEGGWKELADNVADNVGDQLPEESDQKSVLFLARDATCPDEAPTPPRPLDDALCARLGTREQSVLPTALEAVFDSDDDIRPVLERVRQDISQGARPESLRILSGVLCAPPSE